jgi:two-component system, NtrC family, nitrogen regulation sensor histidine kinase NtrY
LKQIQDKISRFKLGSTNEKIEWKRNDELGKLVNEYNKMIDELERSAELLAKSERESAWREMAKQVAHEIKNPLTPMKLNIQHLQNILKDNDSLHKEKIDRITKTLIEQIDVLSGIASEFSDFAKLSHTKNEKIDLYELITNSIDLYKNTENWEISFESEKGKYFVLADYKQLLRVFTNLITNAIQAIDDREKGVIKIEVKSSDNDILISVSDNGKGISDEEKARIFSPNFTTKSAGSGLGLSMVKNIIETAGGKIRFESELNKGTIFYILLPAFNKS